MDKGAKGTLLQAPRRFLTVVKRRLVTSKSEFSRQEEKQPTGQGILDREG